MKILKHSFEVEPDTLSPQLRLELIMSFEQVADKKALMTREEVAAFFGEQLLKEFDRVNSQEQK